MRGTRSRANGAHGGPTSSPGWPHCLPMVDVPNIHHGITSMASPAIGRPPDNPPLETNTASKNLEEQPWYHGLRPRKDIL
ncbi:hypothetical protein Y032_0089g2234 [Ancylostoma ceylanicum]|uniref:Uncharacterized protein n=1 Tax=Ancylostoma ceylanicum TaxID=53326 RepID=A0A016TNA3_9BILA|nr:hypothetical protein Y032_0089g2234 [Ancylostoma ceylanicum]